MDASVDWARLERLLPLAGVSLDQELASAARERKIGGFAVATAFQGLRPRATRLLDVARNELAKGAHGRADAALTAALERPHGLGPLEPTALLLRGLIRLGTPETDERTLIDPQTALTDLSLAVRRIEALIDPAVTPDPALSDRLPLALLAAAWAAYCAGEASRARAYADRVVALAPEATAAIYLAAKAAAAGGETEVAAARLAKALAADPGLADRARADADFQRIAEVRDEALAKLSADATAALDVVEAARRRLAEALADDQSALPQDVAPAELFLETPRPPRDAPCSAVMTVANLARRALQAALQEIDGRVAQERIEVEWRLRDAADRRHAAEDAARRAASAGAALGGAIGCSLAAAPWLAPGVVERYAPALVDLTTLSSGAALQLVLGAPLLLLVWLGPAFAGALAFSMLGAAVLTRRARRSAAARAADAAAVTARTRIVALLAIGAAQKEASEILDAGMADPRLARVWAEAREPAPVDAPVQDAAPVDLTAPSGPEPAPEPTLEPTVAAKDPAAASAPDEKIEPPLSAPTAERLASAA